MLKKLIAVFAAVVMLMTFIPVFAVSEDIKTASDKADAFWDSMIPIEKEWLSLNLSKEEFVKKAYALYKKDKRVTSIRINGNDSFSFYVGSIPCIYSYNIRLKALTVTEKEGISKTEIINYGTKAAHGKDVFVVAPYYGYQSSFTSYYQDLGKQLAQQTGGTYTGLIGNNATAPAIRAYFASAQNTVAAFFDSHGDSYGTNSSYLCLHTNTGITQSDYNSGYAFDFGSGYYGIDGRYMTSGMTIQLNDLFLWMAICEGMMTDGMATPFRQSGAGVVFGYSQSVSFTGDYAYAKVFWPLMMNGATVAEAALKMKQQCGYYDDGGYGYPDAYPIFVSEQDPYPYNPDALQTVNSTWTLDGDPIQYFTVTFVDWDDTVLKTETVEEGHAATAPDNPERTGYTFTGWDTAFAYVQSDLTVKALYNINRYNVLYYVDEIFYHFDEFEYGAAITPCEEPEKEGYTFSGWSEIPETMPANDVSVYGTFSINTYKVTFLDKDDNEITTVTVNYNEAAVAPEAPVYEGYTFIGWDKDFSHVTEDMTVKAMYEPEHPEYCVVRFLGWDDEVLSVQTVAYGQSAVAPEEPIMHDGYVFKGWDKDFSCVKEDIDVRAVFEEIHVTPEPPEPELGDANGDGKINTADAVIILKYAAGMTNLDAVQLKTCDVNKNGQVNTADATFILKYAAGMITEF